MTTFEYSVTFEFNERAPLTHRGFLEASGASAGARRAVLAAKKILKPRKWSSLVVVLAEGRIGGGGER